MNGILNFVSFVVLEIEPEASQMLGTTSTAEINPSPMLNINKGIDGMIK